MRVLHALAHALGWNKGEVISYSGAGGRTFVAFRCRGCGQVSGVEETTDLYERIVASRGSRGPVRAGR